MKLQYFIIIFIIISIPIILLLTHYMSLQKTTLDLQTSYDSKLIESTKQAMEAFEVNTVEWDNGFSRYGDSKRRDILASINAFKNSFANSLNITGTTKESIQTYIPAILYNLYDGFYIYTPTSVPLNKKNQDGIQLFQDNKSTSIATTDSVDEDGRMNKVLYVAQTGGKTYTYKYIDEEGNTVTETLTGLTIDVNNAQKEYKHILKTFIQYSEKINNAIVDYTLDNYLRINTKTESREGYLIDTSKLKNSRGGAPQNTISLKYDNITIGPEELSEHIKYIDIDGTIKDRTCYYAYNTNNEKVYFDEVTDRFFKIINNKRVNYNELCRAGSYECEYKSVSIVDENNKIRKLYQPINGAFRYVFYDESIINHPENIATALIDYNDNPYGLTTSLFAKPYLDFSAINYYTEGYAFTMWVNGLDLADNLKINTSNNPEDESSKFNEHKKEVMKKIIIDNLNLAISSYSAHSNFKYTLPVFTYQDWDQILSNVSMTTFVQGIPIGLKYYNNYVIAISSNNKEYFNPQEIYYTSSADYYYHTKYCEKILCRDCNVIGYKNIDFNLQSIEKNNATYHYFGHSGVGTANQKCYYCLISRSFMRGEIREKEKYDIAYIHALARERYVQSK